MNRDLTVGKPGKVLWNFCLPLFGSVVFQQLYNLADSFTAGKFIGENALAAVGNSYEITLIYIAFAFGCNIACSVITSGFFGAKCFGRMKTGISTAMISSGAICLILMTGGMCFGEAQLRMINTPAELMSDSLLYLRIYTLGLPFVFFYNISTGIFSAMGDSRTPFYFLAASSLSNIAMDILFVRQFGMGVAGVGWATLICQGISCIFSMIFMLRRLREMNSSERFEIFSMPVFRQLAAVAIPSILQQSFISVGNIIIQGVINGFGPGVIAGYSAGVKLNNLVITSFTTLGNGMSNFTAQNIGAERYERIREGLTAGLRMVWSICLPLTLLYMIFPKQLLNVFMDVPSDEALRSGVFFLRILAPFYFVVSTKLIADGILRGAKEMRRFTTATFVDLVLRVVLAAVLSQTSMRYIGVWSAWPIGWTIATAISVVFCRRTIHSMVEGKTVTL